MPVNAGNHRPKTKMEPQEPRPASRTTPDASDLTSETVHRTPSSNREIIPLRGRAAALTHP
jgi:hypothetical protein